MIHEYLGTYSREAKEQDEESEESDSLKDAIRQLSGRKIDLHNYNYMK